MSPVPSGPVPAEQLPLAAHDVEVAAELVGDATLCLRAAQPLGPRQLSLGLLAGGALAAARKQVAEQRMPERVVAELRIRLARG